VRRALGRLIVTLVALWPTVAPHAQGASKPSALPLLPGTTFQVHFIDVGTGDSAIIKSGDHAVIIDGGNSPKRLYDYAKAHQLIDGPIDLVIVTHGDSDHWKGLTRLLGFDGKSRSKPSVLEFWEPGYDRDCKPNANYEAFIANMKAVPGIRFLRPLEETYPPSTTSRTLSPIRVFENLTLTVLSTASVPETATNDCSYRINNASIVIKAAIDNATFLFTGDANGKRRPEAGSVVPIDVEQQLVDLETALPGALKSDVLKVPHHGSETASTQRFIDAVDPCFVVISASATHHLPKKTTVERYDDGKRTVLRTDKDPFGDKDSVVCSGGANVPVRCDFLGVLEGLAEDLAATPGDGIDLADDDACGSQQRGPRRSPQSSGGGAGPSQAPPIQPTGAPLMALLLMALPSLVALAYLMWRDQQALHIIATVADRLLKRPERLSRNEIGLAIDETHDARRLVPVVPVPTVDQVLRYAAMKAKDLDRKRLAEDIESMAHARRPRLAPSFVCTAFVVFIAFFFGVYSTDLARAGDVLVDWRAASSDIYTLLKEGSDEVLGALLTLGVGGLVSQRRSTS